MKFKLSLIFTTLSLSIVSCNSSSLKARRIRSAHSDKSRYWPNAVIPYKVDYTINYQTRQKIKDAIALWEEDTCVQFRERSYILNEPHLVFQDSGFYMCSSSVGITKPNGQRVEINDKCWNVGTVAHELGHTLGLWHEQSRPDRDEHVKVILDNMAKVYRHNYDIQNDTDTYGLPYDYGSLMHYDAFANSLNGNMTLVPLDPTGGSVMGQREKPDFQDIKLVNLMYNCSDRCSQSDSVDECENSGYLAWSKEKACHCVCPSEYEGDSCQHHVEEARTCGGKLTSEGTLATPNFPIGYTKDTNCIWWLKAPQGYRVEIIFQEFSINLRNKKYDDCLTDELRIRKINVFSGFLGDTFCGNELNETRLISDNQDMILDFKTTKEGKGFQARVQFIPSSNLGTCGKYITSPEVIDLSDEFQGNDTICEWFIRAPLEKRVKLTFENFNLGSCELAEVPSQHANCSENIIEIGFFNGTSKRFQGTSLVSQVVKSSTQYLSIILRTYAPNIRLKAEVEFVDPDKPCGGKISFPTEISSPNYPLPPPKVQCQWDIKAPEGKGIRVYFQDFQLSDRYSNPGSSLFGKCRSVSYMKTEVGYSTDTYCGEELREKTLSAKGSLSLTFYHNSKTRIQGFSAKIDFI